MNEEQARIRIRELCQASCNLFDQITEEGFDLGEDVEFMLSRWNNLSASILMGDGAIKDFDPKIAVKLLFKETSKSLKIIDDIVINRHKNQIKLNTTVLTGIIVNIDAFVEDLEKP